MDDAVSTRSSFLGLGGSGGSSDIRRKFTIMTSYASPTISQSKRMVYSSPVQGPVSSMQHRYVSGQATHPLPSQYTNYANYTTSGGPKYHPLDTKQVTQFSYSISPLYNPVHVPTFESTLQVRGVDEGRLLSVWKDQIEAKRVYVSEELSESS